MEKQQRLEIGGRIRELRENSAETNRSIAEFVGVGERSVAAWLAGGGIAWDNAKKVAELFGVDVDYIWRGKLKSSTPDPFATESTAADDEIHQLRAEIAALRTELRAGLATVREVQASLLRRQEPPESGEGSTRN